MPLNILRDNTIQTIEHPATQAISSTDERDMRDPTAGKGFIMHNTRTFIQEMTRGIFNWSEKKSIWPLTFGIKCCAIEMMAFGAARYDCDRMGVFFRATPRQADLLIIAGPATIKLKDVILRLYEQMPHPKYVIAFGECAICGGPFFDSYSVINGVDKLIPVDVYVPGCPPRPEQLLLAIMKLQEVIDEKNMGRSPGKTATISVAGLPQRSREEILAEVLAHPTMHIGLQSGEQRYTPTPQELLLATPTGQPAKAIPKPISPLQLATEKKILQSTAQTTTKSTAQTTTKSTAQTTTKSTAQTTTEMKTTPETKVMQKQETKIIQKAEATTTQTSKKVQQPGVLQ